jgi:hypothetical protein
MSINALKSPNDSSRIPDRPNWRSFALKPQAPDQSRNTVITCNPTPLSPLAVQPDSSPRMRLSVRIVS